MLGWDACDSRARWRRGKVCPEWEGKGREEDSSSFFSPPRTRRRKKEFSFPLEKRTRRKNPLAAPNFSSLAIQNAFSTRAASSSDMH